MNILITRGNIKNAKTYPEPLWNELSFELIYRQHEVKEVKGILTEQEIIDLVNWSDIWIGTDSFLQHLVAYYKLKKGIVIWSKSDPDIFGYPDNINLLKDRKYLRVNQFRSWTDTWNDIENNPDSFVSPSVVLKAIESML